MSEIYISNKEQVQFVKDWWKKYGTAVLTGVVAFLVVSVGTKYWRQHVARQGALASIAYSQMIAAQAQSKDDETKLFAERLIKDFPRSPYASFASMMLAKCAVNENNLIAARKYLHWVVRHESRDELRELARLREARVLLAEGKPKEALNLLQEGNSLVYAAAKHEIMGDAWLAQQDAHANMDKSDHGKKNAVINYRKALRDDDGKLASPLLQLKAEQFGD